MRVRYTRRARDDVEAVLRYVDQRSRSGSNSIRRAIRDSASLISRFPYIGTLAGEGNTRVLPIGRYPYLMYWEVAEGAVTILHIRHAARQQPALV